ncbi:hypothetical protein RHO15_08080 [Utexia brackfieldae]|uniref:hypothetical protein n=1 Tax=Utexia brackfieldae TaxID=3074108 RepID=UPI00370D2696
MLTLLDTKNNRMIKKIFIIANSKIASNFKINQIKVDDIVILFNSPERTDIKPNILFVANTIHPAKKFYRSRYFLDFVIKNKNIKLIFPYSNETIKNIPTLEKTYKLIDKMRGWESNGALKILKKSNAIHEFIELDRYQKLCSKLKINPAKYIPSTGILAIDYVLDNFDLNEYQVNIVGFTFNGSACHNFKNEKEYVDNLIERNILISHTAIATDNRLN